MSKHIKPNLRHILAAMIAACFTFLAAGVYAEESSDSVSHLLFSKSHQQPIVDMIFGKGDKFSDGYDFQACQSKFQPCFSNSDCCGSMMCQEHGTAGWVCYQ